jgi:hypothetical protein
MLALCTGFQGRRPGESRAAETFWREDDNVLGRGRQEIAGKIATWVQVLFYQVNYGLPLEMDIFFLLPNSWRVAKIQDLGNKLSQSVGVALRHHQNAR